MSSNKHVWIFDALLYLIAVIQTARGLVALSTAHFEGSTKYGSYVLEGSAAQAHGAGLLFMGLALAALAYLHSRSTKAVTLLAAGALGVLALSAFGMSFSLQ